MARSSWINCQCKVNLSLSLNCHFDSAGVKKIYRVNRFVLRLQYIIVWTLKKPKALSRRPVDLQPDVISTLLRPWLVQRWPAFPGHLHDIKPTFCLSCGVVLLLILLGRRLVSDRYTCILHCAELSNWDFSHLLASAIPHWLWFRGL